MAKAAAKHHADDATGLENLLQWVRANARLW